MVQFATSTLTDVTDRPITSGIISSTEMESFRNDVETRIAALNDAAQALASFQAGSSASESLRGSIWADTANTGRVIWKGDPDANGPDDEILTRLEAYRVSLATGGTATCKPGGTISVDTTQVSRTTTGVLMTYTLPANTLDANNKFVEVVCFGTRSGAVGTFSLQPRFGTTAITTHSAASTGITDWFVNFFIVRTGAATQDCGSYIVLNMDADGSTTLCDFATATQTLSGALAIDVNLSAIAAGTVTQEIMIVKYGGGP